MLLGGRRPTPPTTPHTSLPPGGWGPASSGDAGLGPHTSRTDRTKCIDDELSCLRDSEPLIIRSDGPPRPSAVPVWAHLRVSPSPPRPCTPPATWSTRDRPLTRPKICGVHFRRGLGKGPLLTVTPVVWVGEPESFGRRPGVPRDISLTSRLPTRLSGGLPSRCPAAGPEVPIPADLGGLDRQLAYSLRPLPTSGGWCVLP